MTETKDARVWFITGASRGFGREWTIAALDRGDSVAATARDVATLDDLAARYGDRLMPIRLDVTDRAGVFAAVSTAHDRFGRVDVLVNNAGIIAYEALDELATADWERIVAVNQTGVWFGMREVIPSMRGNRSGSIINVSSIWGNVAVSGAHAYHATKGAVRTMSKSAAITYAKDNVRVNSLHPGFILTPLTEAQDPAVNDFVVSQTPMGRAGLPREIAQGVVFLASDESSFVTGSELVIDGGYLAQ